MMIGAIADDVTGASDVAVALRREGLRTLLFFGIPPEGDELPAHDALVVALKSRMIPAADAVAQSRDALRWLLAHRVTTTYFKFCSTFDSTSEGNIGPVLDALASDLGARSVVMTPSSPEHGRTQYRGHLFVGDLLLSESHMRHHPVTPMTDSNLVSLLRGQSGERVALIDHSRTRGGETAIRAAIAQAEADGDRYLLVDAIDGRDLRGIGAAALGAPLVAGAAGLAGGLAAAVAATRSGDRVVEASAEQSDILRHGPAAVIAGSCSARTLEQIAELVRSDRPAFHLDVLAERRPEALAAAALSWYDALNPSPAPLFYSSATPAELRVVQETLGAGPSAEILETATGLIARGLIERGVRKLVSAGGETSGAVVAALGVTGGIIGEEEARGVPWIFTASEHPLALLLKSGNFGDADLLVRASETTGSTVSQASRS
jgi:uncharacterized protein YgbK (DUF1537 family)